MNIVIIDYNAGNTQSVIYALQRLGIEPVVSADAELIRSADRVIFPGVGAAAFAMDELRKRGLDSVIPTLKNPFLGICLGMQIMCTHSEEGNTPCLGIFDVPVVRFSNPEFKVPHMGWNRTESDIYKFENQYFYYVHSYIAPVCNHTIATCNYGVTFSAALRKDNFTGVQFHPEKSAEAGEKLLKEFVGVLNCF